MIFYQHRSNTSVRRKSNISLFSIWSFIKIENTKNWFPWPVSRLYFIFTAKMSHLERHFNILFATSHYVPFRYISFSFFARSFVTPKTKFLKHPAINSKKDVFNRDTRRIRWIFQTLTRSTIKTVRPARSGNRVSRNCEWPQYKMQMTLSPNCGGVSFSWKAV